MSMILGYARVSTKDQNLDGQRDAHTRAGAEGISAGKIRVHIAEMRQQIEGALRASTAYLWRCHSGCGTVGTEARQARGMRRFVSTDSHGYFPGCHLP